MKHDYETILNEALENEGIMNEQYTAFHNYSLGNQFLARCQLRKCEPINTFKGWQALGRTVKKGEKAITLLYPFVFSKEKDNGETEINTFFKPRNLWFGLSQTEGSDYKHELPPEITKDRLRKMMLNLNIAGVPFEHHNGNVMGYAKGRTIAINPLDKNPLGTLFHEIGHILLGHTLDIHEYLAIKNVCETEAESVSYLVMACLGLHTDTTKGHSSRYIKSWLENPKNDMRLNKVFKAVDDILKALAQEPKTLPKTLLIAA